MSDAEHRTHTALHIVKGAARMVLGTKWTASTYVSDGHGMLVVSHGSKPSEEAMQQIESLANQKVRESAEIRVEELLRDDAEKKYGDEIYDLFPIPSDIRVLKVVSIPGWNVNACNKKHTQTTREIGKISIGKWRYRNSRQMLEIPFDVEPSIGGKSL